MSREIVLRIPEERAEAMLERLEYLAAIHDELADLCDLLQRAINEAYADRLKQIVD